MRTTIKQIAKGQWQIALLILFTSSIARSQSVKWYQTTQEKVWKETKVRLSSKPVDGYQLQAFPNHQGPEIKAFGTTFNELDWKALSSLKSSDQDEIMRRIFAPDGDLRFTRGRISMNANDYALSWYSCDTVDGDFGLRHFNINRDKTTIIPLIHAAQKYN